LIITVVTLALWSANLIDHNAVAGILLTSQVVNVVAFFGSEIFKKGFLIWAVKVVMASLLFIVASSIALETSWEFVDLIFGRSVVSGVPWYKHIDAISQDYTPFVLMAQNLAVMWLLQNRKKQIAFIDATECIIAKTVEDLMEMYEKPGPNVRATIVRALDRILGRALKPATRWRSQQSTRTAIVLVPNGNYLHAAYMFPPRPEYAKLKRHFVVPRWDDEAVTRLHAEAARNRDRNHVKERELLHAHASLSGYAEANGGLHCFPDLGDYEYAHDQSKYLPPERRNELRPRSAAAIRLEHDGQVYGVLLLLDSAVGGFMNPDKSMIQVMASLACPFVAMAVRMNLFKLAELPHQEAHYGVEDSHVSAQSVSR